MYMCACLQVLTYSPHQLSPNTLSAILLRKGEKEILKSNIKKLEKYMDELVDADSKDKKKKKKKKQSDEGEEGERERDERDEL